MFTLPRSCPRFTAAGLAAKFPLRPAGANHISDHLPETTSSTRRFCCRPSAVSFEATGWFFPKPCAVMDAEGMPSCPR